MGPIVRQCPNCGGASGRETYRKQEGKYVWKCDCCGWEMTLNVLSLPAGRGAPHKQKTYALLQA
jgi:ribosomal protein L37AE/L43A